MSEADELIGGAWRRYADDVLTSMGIALSGVTHVRKAITKVGERLETYSSRPEFHPIMEELMNAVRSVALVEYLMADSVGLTAASDKAKDYLMDALNIPAGEVGALLAETRATFEKQRKYFPSVETLRKSR